MPTPQSAEKTPGLDAFTFDYAVEWPLSLVLSKNAVIKWLQRKDENVGMAATKQHKEKQAIHLRVVNPMKDKGVYVIVDDA